MLKGKSVIELTDVHTGEVERYEDTNLVTEAVRDILNVNIMGMLYNNTSFNESSGDGWMLPLKKNIMGGILLYQNALEEREDNIYAPLDNPIVGYASDDANNTTDTKRGSRNLTESKVVDGGYRFVWDFQTSQANGTISAICLTNTLAGRGTEFTNNYMLRIGLYSGYRTDPIPDTYLKNKRLYIEEGYRLEMVTRYNSTQAVLQKYMNDYLHASLVTRPATRIVTEPEEETTIEIGHAPYYYHYTGGGKDGTEEPSNSSSEAITYLFHASDGRWYGIARRDNQKYNYTSGSKDYYTHVDYEWYMDTIDGDKCTSQKIAVPSGINEFHSLGMSGKWLMCYTGDKVYRIDTANVANIELVSNITYTSSHYLTYIVDDDIVINGWYFLNGEPKLHIRDISSDKDYSWGHNQMARYKTFAVKEWVHSSNNYYVRRELFLFTPYLATINNLATPVIKTADKTMKITYTVTEE